MKQHTSHLSTSFITRRTAQWLLFMTVLCVSWIATAFPGEAGENDIQQRAVLSAARNSLERDDVTSALSFYERYLQMNPDDAVVSLEYAEVLIHAERFQQALRVCDALLEDDPSHPDAQRLRAVALSQIGQLSEAIDMAERLATRFPDDTEIRRLVTGFRSRRGDPDVALDIRRELDQQGVRTAEDWEVYLQLLATNREWDAVLRVYKDYREQITPTDGARVAVIRAYLARYEPEQARRLFQDIEGEREQREAALLIADQLAAAERPGEAVRFLEPVARAWPQVADLSLRLALLYAYDQRPVQAVHVLADIPPEVRDERILVTRAEVYKAAGQPYMALRELDRVPAGQRSVRAALTYAGALYDLHREWEIPVVLAAADAESAQSEEADRKLAWTLTALAHVRAGDSDAAQRVIERFRNHAPHDTAPDILAALAENAARNTRRERAAAQRLGARLRTYSPGLDLVRPVLLDDVHPDAWRAAWNLNPNNAEVLLRLADATFNQGQIDRADELYEQAAAYQQTRSSALLGRAACALRTGDTREVERLIGLLKGDPLYFSQKVQAARLLLAADLDGLANYFISALQENHSNHPETVAVQAAWLIRGRRLNEGLRLLVSPELDLPAGKGTAVFQLSRMGELAKDADDPVYEVAVDRLRTLGEGASDASGLDALLPAVDLMLRFGRYADARDTLESAQQDTPGDIRLAERLMVVHIRLGRYEDAEAQLRMIHSRRPLAVEPRLLLARIRVWTSEYPKAWDAYRALIADYPGDDALALEYRAKQSAALERYRKAAGLYADFLELRPDDREMRLEHADAYFLRDLSHTAAELYADSAIAQAGDSVARQSQTAAEWRTSWGAYGHAAFEKRQGRDGAVDIRQDALGAGALFPRGPDGLQLSAGINWLRWEFDDTPEDEPDHLRANELRLQGTQIFHSGAEARGEVKLVDDRIAGTTWHAELDVGYRGLEGWKAAVIAGREILRDNFYTISDALPRTWLGVYGQWRPLTRLDLFAQARVVNTGSPSQDIALPERTLDLEQFEALETDPAPAGRLSDALEQRPDLPLSSRQMILDTQRRNTGYEGVLDGAWTLLYFPRNLDIRVNGFVYETRRDSLLYWTPERTFYSGEVGLYWRHELWLPHYPGARSLFYGAYTGVGRDSESDSFGSLAAELGWTHTNGFGLHAEVAGVWSKEYDERHARIYGDYRF